MASVFTPGGTIVDYSIRDGRVRSFKLDGELLFDEDKGVALNGWEARLTDWVQRCGLNDGKRGNPPAKQRGFSAFIYPLVEQGKLTLVNID